MNRQLVESLLSKADEMKIVVKESGGTVKCKHKILGCLFFEPSTRTNCSFQAAMMRLGGSVMNVNDIWSSTQKGETLSDTVRTLACYCDIIVIRHPLKGVLDMLPKIDVPIINGGDGSGEHPTQALLDLYTIKSELGLENLTVTLMGDLKNGRTVHSLVRLLKMFCDTIKLIYVAPDGLEMPKEIVEELEGILEQKVDTLENAIKVTDVLYVTRIQKERILGDVPKNFCVDENVMKSAKTKMIVMHPLPRLDELSSKVDSDPRAVYFRQMENGVYMRMAILDWLLGDS